MQLLDFLIGLEDYRVKGLYRGANGLGLTVFARNEKQGYRRLRRAAQWVNGVMTPELEASLLSRVFKRPDQAKVLTRE